MKKIFVMALVAMFAGFAPAKAQNAQNMLDNPAYKGISNQFLATYMVLTDMSEANALTAIRQVAVQNGFAHSMSDWNLCLAVFGPSGPLADQGFAARAYWDKMWPNKVWPL